MAHKVFVDTSAFMALVSRSDKNHAASVKYFESTTSQTILITSDYIFDETVTLINARIGHHAATQFISEFKAYQVVLIPTYPVYFNEGIRIFSRYHDQSFSFTDCTSFAYMQVHEIPEAFTFDQDFARAGFLIVPTQDR